LKKIIIVFAAILSMLFSVSATAQSEVETAPVTQAEEIEYESVFETLFQRVEELLPEILSLITLSASLVLAFAFKKGLVPLLSNTLAKIGDSVTHIKEKGDENGKIIDTFGEKVSCRIEMLESLISDLTEKLNELAVSLDEAERRAGDREKLTTLINGQIDMLYDVFMSSSLPHYQKEAVGARIAEMREAIKDDEGK
jgi:hypothetical protein